MGNLKPTTHLFKKIRSKINHKPGLSFGNCLIQFTEQIYGPVGIK